MEQEQRKLRKKLVGEVKGRWGGGTVKVVFFYKKPHPLFRKEIKRKTVLYAHDQDNECQVGDWVEIMSVRPLSHLKRWRVVRLLEKVQG